jgi:hypothetical protein
LPLLACSSFLQMQGKSFFTPGPGCLGFFVLRSTKSPGLTLSLYRVRATLWLMQAWTATLLALLITL